MKKIKFLLLALMAVVLCSCGYDINDLAEDVRADIERDLENDWGCSVCVEEVIIYEIEENYYEGTARIYAEGERDTFEIAVETHGDWFEWELYY
jgi:hypothetical protein